METKYCQSCGMPLTSKDVMGSNQDHTTNEDYCLYCFKDGNFTYDCTMEQMIDWCAKFMVQEGFEEQSARNLMAQQFPTLKRWKKND